jgi:fumarate reductase subunit D
MAQSKEPLVWAPFFAGAGLSALFMPVLIIIVLIAGYTGMRTSDFRDMVDHWYVRLILFGLISLSLFHAMHRIRFLLVDLGLKRVKLAIAAICYGLAIIGTLVTLMVATGILGHPAEETNSANDTPKLTAPTSSRLD